MAFGDASAPPLPHKSKAKAKAKAPDFTSPERVNLDFLTKKKPKHPLSHSTSIDDLLVFDHAWILDHLNTLNESSEPRLNELQLLKIGEKVAEEYRELIGELIEGVWGQIAPVLAIEVAVKKFPGQRHSEGEGIVGTRGGLGRGAVMGTPLLGQFLTQINGFIQVKNESALADYLVLEPPFGDHYQRMIQELKQSYPKGKDAALEDLCDKYLTAAKKGEDGSPWTPFIKFMVQYLGYLREVDMDPGKYLETYNLLSELQSRANSALTHGTLGYLILGTVVTNAKLVCRLAIGLDRQPQLIAHLKSQSSAGGEDGGASETLPERAANILRQAFVTCLNDRTPVPTGSKPEGRKRGIYIIANLCLKILFQCRKTRNATQIFENIYNLSPPLASYPKRERVTYLYYLGRFYFQNSHFYRAQIALQAAYDESPARQECVRQRRHILIYLVASNIILGRFPSQQLLRRPEAQGLAERFLPLCQAIRKGDLATFHRHLDLNGPHADWFLHFRILLQLQNRCEVLVWRSLVRKTWILAGVRPPSGSKVTPTVDYSHLIAAFTYLSKQHQSRPADYTDPDFAGVSYGDNPDEPLYGVTEMESLLSSLIDQGLLGGFFSHGRQKFAITGVSKHGGDILAAGFPRPWEVLSGRAEKERVGGELEAPGWKKENAGGLGGLGGGLGGMGGMRPGPGMVFNLSGARPVGAAG